MIGLPIQFIEWRPVAAEKKEVRSLIDDAPAAAAFIRIGLYPADRGARPLDELEGVANRTAFAIPGGAVIQPHPVEFEVFGVAGVGYDLAGGSGIERITELQHAHQFALQKDAKVNIGVVDDPAGVMVCQDDFHRLSAGDRSEVKVPTAEPGQTKASVDVSWIFIFRTADDTGNGWMMGLPIAQERPP